MRQVVGDLAVTLFLHGKIASRKLFKRRRLSGAKDSGTFADGAHRDGSVDVDGGVSADEGRLIQDDPPVSDLEDVGELGDEVVGDPIEIADGYAVDLFGDIVPFTPESDADEGEGVEVGSPDQTRLFDDVGDTLDVDMGVQAEINGGGDVSDDTEGIVDSDGISADEDEAGIDQGNDVSATGNDGGAVNEGIELGDGVNQDADEPQAAITNGEEPRVITHRGSMGQLVRDDDKPPQQPGRRVPTNRGYPRLEPARRRVKLRCQTIGDRWSLYLDIPEGREVSRVVQDSVELPTGAANVTLKSFTGLVVVRYEDGDVEVVPAFDAMEERDGIVFKTGKNWEGGMSLVRRAGNGYAIVFGWRDRDEDWGSGIVEHGREECVDERFQAYFLELTGVGSPNNTDRVIFNGRTIYDDADVGHYGELYIGAAPDLIVGNDVTVARVVRETGVMAINKRSFRRDFYPRPHSLDSVLESRDGWFGIRVYVDGDLRDNPPFRLCRRLARILMDGEEYAGGANLYMRGEGVSLRFESQDGEALLPDGAPVAFGSDGMAILGADMDTDALEFRFGNTPVFIEVPRLRWRLVDEDGHVGEWGNDILRFEATRFRNLIDSRIEISAPNFVSRIRVGFASDDVSYASGGVSGEWRISLPHFADHRAVADMGDEDLPLMIFAEGQNATIARIIVDPSGVDDAIGAVDDHTNAAEDSANRDSIQGVDRWDIIRLHEFCQNQRAVKGVVDKGKGRPYYSRERRDYVIGRRED